MFFICFFVCYFTAGRTTTNEELEEMLEQGNPAVFTQGVSYLIIQQQLGGRRRIKRPSFILTDHHGDAASQANAGRHRSSPR